MYITFLKDFGIHKAGDTIRIERFYTEYGPDIDLLKMLCENGYTTRIGESDR